MGRNPPRLILTPRYGLPFVAIDLVFRGKPLRLNHALVDTGAASTVIKYSQVRVIGIESESGDALRTLTGIGGSETVFLKQLDRLSLNPLSTNTIDSPIAETGNFSVTDFEVEVGTMNYGFDIDAILGMNFLTRIRAVIDLHAFTLSASPIP